MRKLAAAVIAATALLLAGCGAQAMSEDDYLAQTAGLDSFAGMTDQQRVAYGQEYCGFLDDFGGNDADSKREAAQLFLSVDEEAGGDVAETALALGYAVQTFCPEHRID